MLAQCPHRVAGPRNADLRTDDAMAREVRGLQLAVVLVPQRLEDFARHAREVELDALPDEHRAVKLQVVELAQACRVQSQPVRIVSERLLGRYLNGVILR